MPRNSGSEIIEDRTIVSIVGPSVKMSKGDKEIRKLIFPRHYYLLPMQPSLVQNCLPSLFGTSNDANEEVTQSMTRHAKRYFAYKHFQKCIFGVEIILQDTTTIIQSSHRLLAFS